MTDKMNVHTSPGVGLLSRRADALLFIPDPGPNSEQLLEAFANASEGGELDALADATVDAELDVPSFAAIQKGQDIVLRVFGDVELRTDVSSVPMLSAAASTTWVEHRVHGSPDVVVVDCGAGAPDTRTNVVLGVVNAGGFAVSLSGPTDRERADLEPTKPETTDPLVSKAEVEGLSSPGDETSVEEKSELLEYVLGAFPKPVVEEEPRQPGQLVFDDGQIHVLTGDVVVGRNPIEKASAAKAEPLIIAGDRVSRSHLKVCVTGDQVWVEDCDSRNGSVLIGSPDGEPFKLLANSPQEVEDGAVVYLGSRSFTFTKGSEFAPVPASHAQPRKDPIYG